MSDQLAAGGWMVKVTLAAAGGEPIERWYAVGLNGKLDAQAAVHRQQGLEDATVDARRPLSITEIETLGLKPEELRKYGH